MSNLNVANVKYYIRQYDDVEPIDIYHSNWQPTFHQKSQLAIDGPSCVGKTTLFKKLKDSNKFKYYSYLKANLFLSNFEMITYNCNMTAAVSYYEIAKEIGKMDFTIQDRSAISNVVYQIVYYLMDCDNISNYKVLIQDYIIKHNLQYVFTDYLNSNINTVFIVNSNLNALMETFKSRDESNVKGSNLKYHLCQLLAFAFVSEYLQILLIDVCFGYDIAYDIISEFEFLLDREKVDTMVKVVLNDEEYTYDSETLKLQIRPQDAISDLEYYHQQQHIIMKNNKR